MNLTLATQLLNHWIILPNSKWYQVLPIAEDGKPGFKTDNGNVISLAFEETAKLEWYLKYATKEIYCG